MWKEVTARVDICKYEEVSLTLDERVLYEYHTSLVPSAEAFPLPLNYTSNDTYCPIISYGIKISLTYPLEDAQTPTADDEYYYKIIGPGAVVGGKTLTDTSLWMYPGGDLGYYPFYVYGMTVSG